MHSNDDKLDGSTTSSRSARTALACSVALMLAAPLVAHAAEAMREVRDPVTGEIRGPTAAEAAAFEKAQAQLRQSRAQGQSRQASTPSATPAEIRHPDGSIETKLDEDTTMYSVVRANEDGSLSMACLPGKQAQAFVKSTSKRTSFAVKPTAKVVNGKQ